ncbi:PAAR domain-containing protein [Lelliottia amnigena]
MQQYTNEITPEIRESHSQPSYDKELLALCDSQTRKELETRNGGVIRHVSGTSTAGGYRMARVGDKVVYPDGSEATIFSGAGKARVMQGVSAALVGSMLDNGDEIISTPQSINKLAFRKGDTLPEGFLTMPGSKH